MPGLYARSLLLIIIKHVILAEVCKLLTVGPTDERTRCNEFTKQHNSVAAKGYKEWKTSPPPGRPAWQAASEMAPRLAVYDSVYRLYPFYEQLL